MIGFLMVWGLLHPSWVNAQRVEQGLNTPTTAGQVAYVYSASGLNLRAEPSEQSSVMAKLPNKSEVTVLEAPTSSQTEVAFLDVSDNATDTSVATGQLRLKGSWIKVKTATEVEGFMFSPLLSRWRPYPNNAEMRGYDISTHLANIFGLGSPHIRSKKVKEDGATYKQTQTDYAAKNGVRLSVEQSYNDYGWGNATLLLPNWQLEEAVVFFVMNLPSNYSKKPFLSSYTKGQEASYMLDEIPNMLEMRKNKSGVEVKWNWGAD